MYWFGQGWGSGLEIKDIDRGLGRVIEALAFLEENLCKLTHTSKITAPLRPNQSKTYILSMD